MGHHTNNGCIMFKKGMEVVKIITGAGFKTASLGTVESVKKKIVKLVQDDILRYDAETGYEIDPVIPGFNSQIIKLET